MTLQSRSGVESPDSTLRRVCVLSAQSRATSAEEVESIPSQSSWEDSPGCWRFSFPQIEAKPEAGRPALGQLLLLKGTLGVAMGEAGRALLSSSWS